MRRRGWVTLLRVLAAGVALGRWCWVSANNPDRRLRRGLEAFDRGDATEAEAIAVEMGGRGEYRHAALLRGTVFFRHGRTLLEQGDPTSALSLFRRALNQV